MYRCSKSDHIRASRKRTRPRCGRPPSPRLGCGSGLSDLFQRGSRTPSPALKPPRGGAHGRPPGESGQPPTRVCSSHREMAGYILWSGPQCTGEAIPHPPQGLGPYGVGGATLPNTHTYVPCCRGAPRQRSQMGGAERRQSTASIGSEVSSMYVQCPGKGSAFYPRDVRLEEVDVDGEGRLRYVRFEHRPIYCIRCVVLSLQAHHLQRGGRRWRSMCMGVRACVHACVCACVHACMRVCVYVCMCACTRMW